MRKLFALALLFASTAAFADDMGLLLGLSSKEGVASTVWIGQQGVATFARRAGDGYWLWQEKGFMHIVPEDLSRSGGRATVTVTDIDGKVSVIKGEEGRPDTDFHVMYVAPRGIGLMRSMNSGAPQSGGNVVSGGQVGGFGGGQNGFAGGSGYRVFPRSYRHHDWQDLATALDVGDVFDEKLANEFLRNAESYASSRISSGKAPVDGDVSPSNWTLRRDQGSWALYGLLYPPFGMSGSGSDLEFPVRGFDNASLGAVFVKGPSWSRIVSEYPDAIDFAVSPDGKMTVIVTPTDVFVHESSMSSLKKRVQRVRVPAERVVMTQWLEGSEVRKVSDAVTKIKG